MGLTVMREQSGGQERASLKSRPARCFREPTKSPRGNDAENEAQGTGVMAQD